METVEEGCALLECISDEEALDELATSPCVVVDEMTDCALELD